LIVDSEQLTVLSSINFQAKIFSALQHLKN